MTIADLRKMTEAAASYEMQVRNDEQKDGKTKPGLSAGKIFYKPGVIEEETDETSAFDSSVVDTPMLGMGLGGSGCLRAPQIYPSSSLHRIPTYSSSIGQSTVYRQDTCRYSNFYMFLISIIYLKCQYHLKAYNTH